MLFSVMPTVGDVLTMKHTSWEICKWLAGLSMDSGESCPVSVRENNYSLKDHLQACIQNPPKWISRNC